MINRDYYLKASSTHHTQTKTQIPKKTRPPISDLWKNQSPNIEQVFKKYLIFRELTLKNKYIKPSPTRVQTACDNK